MSRRDARHVLLICADQLRAGALSCYGDPIVRTPNIDELAKRGCTFLRHYSSAAPCGPARACLLTGLYARNHRMVSDGTPLDGRTANLATELLRGGIRSYLVGYTDTILPSTPAPSLGTLPGFLVHTHFNLHREGLTEWVASLERAGYGPFVSPFEAFEPTEPGGRTCRYPATESDTAFIADRTLQCIRERSNDPWLIHATFLRPHAPWVAPRPYDQLYARERMEVPPASSGIDHPFLRYWRSRMKADADVRAIRAVYAGLVTELDFHVGRILAELRERALLDRTLVIFTSDHGGMLGEDGLLGTGGYHDAAYQVPLIVSDPCSPSPGRRSVQFTESVDIVSTVVDWLGLPALERTDGHSLLPIIRGEPVSGPRAEALWEFDFRFAAEALGLAAADCTLTALRTEREKYVHFRALRPLCFDMAEDPLERMDRALDPDYRERVQALQRRLVERCARDSSASGV